MRIEVVPDDPLPPPPDLESMPPPLERDEDYVPKKDDAGAESSSESDAPTSDSDREEDHRDTGQAHRGTKPVSAAPRGRGRGGGAMSRAGQKRKRQPQQQRGPRRKARPASEDFIPAAFASESKDDSGEVKNQGPPKRPRRAAAPKNLSDDTGDRPYRKSLHDYEDDRDVDDDEEDEGPRHTHHPDDAWLHQGLSEEDLKNMDPTGFLKKRHENWDQIQTNPYHGHAEATDDTGNTTYCYMCENQRRARDGTDESLHYDTLRGFLNGFKHMSMHCATFFAVKYYDQYIYPATKKVMTQQMFMNHILKHDPSAPLLNKWMLVHAVDVQLMIRAAIKPLRPGEPPDRDSIRMMHANHKELRQCLSALQKSQG